MKESPIYPQDLLHPSSLHTGEESTKRRTPFPITTRTAHHMTALVITLLLCLWVSATNAATTSFTPLGFQAGGTNSLAFDVSGDGSTVVGYGGSALGNQAFYWTSATGMVGSGVASSFAYGVNQDGSVIVGSGSASSSKCNALDGCDWRGGRSRQLFRCRWFFGSPWRVSGWPDRGGAKYETKYFW